MMKVTRIVASAVIFASLGVGILHAQNLRDVQAPAEFPPASFKGTQYVDSKGCVYIRAGIDGNVTWVPRVNRQRKLLCGQTPTQVAQGTPRAAPAAQTPVQITVAQPTAPAPAAKPRVVQTKPKPVVAPRVAAKPATKPVPRATVRQPTILAAPTPQKPTQPKVVKVAPAKPAVRKTVTVARRQAACPGASAISQRYINSGVERPVRCGPQDMSRHAGTRVVTSGTTPGVQTRVVPRHVYEERQLDNVFQVPEGYRAVWNDDRLNPRRAEQSLQGIASSRLVWTNTVPYRLVEQRTGRDVTSTVPLVYPYTDAATQQRELGSVTIVQRNGHVMKRIVRNRSAVRQPTVSTRSAPAPVAKPQVQAKPKAVVKGRYVHVGTYSNGANAKSAAQRLARSGLPARMGTLKRGGKSYQVVLAGPFDSTAGLQRALGEARAAGFSDAFVRK